MGSTWPSRPPSDGSVSLASPTRVRRLLERYGIRPRKRWGQNFLIDRNLLEQVVRAAELTPGDRVVEIGPGLGILTRELACHAAAVLAIEIDPILVTVLTRETVADLPNVTILAADALAVDLAAEARRVLGPPPYKVVANIPYAITSPLLQRLLERPGLFSLIVLMVQREVADRLAAAPGSGEYGAFTVFTQFYAEVERLATVTRRAFWPPPEVDSAIVRLRPRRQLPEVDVATLMAVVRAAFQQRRKRLLNALAGSRELALPRERLAEALAEAGIDPARRAETLSVAEFVRLAGAIHARRTAPIGA
mgnify:CR=1 FL=1